MNCPKCTGQLSAITIREEITLDRCDRCYGLWCKPEQLTRLKREWMSEALVDVGNPDVGAKLDDLTDVPCPEGHGDMVTRADPEQPHIRYEECRTCNGMFLDAGEFTDLKFKTLLDWIKARLLAR